MDQRALEIYQEVVSKHNLSSRGVELGIAVEAFQARIGSLQEDIVSSLVVLLPCSPFIVLMWGVVKQRANQRLDAIQEALEDSGGCDEKPVLLRLEVLQPLDSP